MKKSSAIKLFKNIFVIPGATNIGVISSGKIKKAHKIYLIDSGMNDDDAIRIYKELELLFPQEKGGFKIYAVINTHSHADHTGGNNYFQTNHNAQIWISQGEAGSIMNPWLQGSVFAGANPLPELTSEYHRAKPSFPNKIISKDSVIPLTDGASFSFVDLKGHYFEMLGIKYTNKNGKSALFCADAFLGRENIIKYWIPYIYDIKEYKNSLEKIDSTQASYFIPSHGQILTRTQETIELNMIAVLSTERTIIHLLEKEEMGTEELVKKIADVQNMNMKNPQFFLITTTIKSYLTYLFSMGLISYRTQENKMIWSAVKEKINQIMEL